MKKVRQLGCILFCGILSVLFCCSSIISVQAAENVNQRTVRVGFFSADGYHIMDEDGTMSGYGYDFLQMMLRYNNWKYEYVGYDKNWGDMLDMLDSGEIDMVTLANKSPERMQKFAYSMSAIGASSTIMTIAADNTEIIPGEYDTYEGRTVGLVDGSAHNDKFEAYAEEKGFSYQTVYYDDIADMLADLRAGRQIDIAVTSNMRLVQDEIILDEFDSTEYFAIVKRGNETLLNEINNGIKQLDVYSPDWRSILFQKYYSDINSRAISFSIDEREYLNHLKENNIVIKAAMNPELKPYAYFEDGEAKGIAPRLFENLAERLGIEYEILKSNDRWEYKEQLDSGQADIDLTAYLDYSLAQKYNLKETDEYISSTMAMLTKKGSAANQNSMVVAIPSDPTEYIGYNNELIYRYDYKEYESIQDCVDSVKKGETDATFLYTYIAEQAVQEDPTNQLQYSIMSDYSFSLAIGVNNEKDHRLLSILNKGVNSIPPNFTQGVMLEESTSTERAYSLVALAYDHPLYVAVAACFVAFILFLIVLLIITNRAQKNKLIASREIERFIGYVCESYELVVEINLKTNHRIVYKMVDQKVTEEEKQHIVFDRNYFEPIVHEEDLPRMLEAFSDETIDRMIAEGGSQTYLECQVQNAEGSYHWYSYIIKAVPKDEQHPRNFIVFKKDIQETKSQEEEQRQILKDALEAARSASAAKGHFLSRMSHEIRTPLNAVIGYMEIAKDSGDNPPKVMHCIENSDMAAKHLLDIINDVLDISSIESGRMKLAHDEFDLKDQLTTLSTIFFHQAKEKQVKFDVVLKGVTEEWVVGDRLRINQILMNLLSNAVKFTPAEGTITLTVAQVGMDEQKVYMKFSVSDTGIGMSEEYKQRLFQPFEQESAETAQKYGGTGLGLSITYNLIYMMGGSVEVISELNKGTTFDVSLFFGRSSGSHTAPAIQQDYSKVRALIVDDDADTCAYMKSLLKRCKVKCDVVTNGEAALQQIKRRMDTDYKYDLCIMDWNMAGMDGIETARRMKEECSEAPPIIIATAYDVTEIADEAEKLGIQKVIAKPLFQSTMFDLLVSTYGKYEPEKPIEKNMESIRGLHVLLAEDNPMNLEIAVEILRKAGLVVDAVTDGRQALDRFLEQPAGTYDAILMDVQMPVMDGYQATGAIRKSAHEEAASIPIIAMTANAFAEDVNAALASGMNDHISKPIDYDKLYAVLNKFCKKGDVRNGQ